MTSLRPDPTFYPSPKMAMEAPPEQIAYVGIVNPTNDGRPDALGVLDVNPESSTYAQVVGRMEFPHAGDELHHFVSSRRRRAAPFRLECVQRRAVPQHASPAR